MNLNEWLRMIAGSFVLVSVVLAVFHSPYWLIFTGFVAVNLIQSSVTGWCPMMAILRKAGVPE
jgi:Inner membrane protein YgaP-like, transmembrane domain